MLKLNFDCRNNSFLEEIPKLEFVPFEDLEEWNRIKVYDRSNSEKKQLYYDRTYLCSCSSEEVKNTKDFIVELLLNDVPIESVKKELKLFNKGIKGVEEV
ncbi:MAG: hypothetical protein J6Y42_00850 [Bacilli bacterium]|nr:hypothetical protein [Bacilli bacterium]